MIQHGVLRFVAVRLAAMVVLLVVLSFLVFVLLYLAPGSPIDALLTPDQRTPETIAALRHEYHLDQPFLTQYWLWAKDAARFQFGTSIQTSLPVTDEIMTRLPTSLLLAVYAFVLTIVFGCGLGVVAAVRQRGWVDRVVVAGSVAGMCTPAFVSGLFLLYVFAIRLKWFPSFGTETGVANQLWHLTLPAITLALGGSAFVLKHTRTSVAKALDQDYVTFARARGQSSGRVLMVYALRNALIPVVTISGLVLSFLITGAVLVEVTFSVSGIGQLLVQSANTKDLPMIQGVSMLVAVVIIVANLLADLAYVAVDPRLRLSKTAP